MDSLEVLFERFPRLKELRKTLEGAEYWVLSSDDEFKSLYEKMIRLSDDQIRKFTGEEVDSVFEMLAYSSVFENTTALLKWNFLREKMKDHWIDLAFNPENVKTREQKITYLIAYRYRWLDRMSFLGNIFSKENIDRFQASLDRLEEE